MRRDRCRSHPPPGRHRRGRGADPARPRGDARRGGLRRRRRGRRRREAVALAESRGRTWSSSTSRCRSSTASPPRSASPRPDRPRGDPHRLLASATSSSGPVTPARWPTWSSRSHAPTWCPPSRWRSAGSPRSRPWSARSPTSRPAGDPQDGRPGQGRAAAQLGLSEPEAFRWIQKTAMDLRLSMREVAEGVVRHGPGGAAG